MRYLSTDRRRLGLAASMNAGRKPTNSVPTRKRSSRFVMRRPPIRSPAGAIKLRSTDPRWLLSRKIFLVDTESEYYDRSRVSSLRAISLDGHEDLPDPPNMRIFLLAGAKHASATWPPAELESQQLRNDPLDYRWAQRGLLATLDKWVRERELRLQFPSQHPMLSGPHRRPSKAKSNFLADMLKAVQWPYRVPGGAIATICPPVP